MTLKTFRLRYGNAIVATVKGKSSLTDREVKEQARLDAQLTLNSGEVPGLLSKIHYAFVERATNV